MKRGETRGHLERLASIHHCIVTCQHDNNHASQLPQEQWQQWNIDLSPLDGLENVTSLTIGVDGDSAAGMLYIDDIRLYPY